MNHLEKCNLVLLLTLLLAGCQPKSAGSLVAEASVPLGPQFSAKNGLLVPEETRHSLGVKVVEVTEQKLVTTVEIPLRVYQVTPEGSLASGSVTPEAAKELGVGSSLVIRIRDGKTVPGKITLLDGQLRKSTGAIEILVAIPSGAERLTVGEFVQASATFETGKSVVTIPRAALLQCSDGYSVYTVSGEHFVRTPVKVGAINADLVEIKDGLYTGDEVVLQPVMSLWLTELAAVKGGQSCCAPPPKGK